jgi:protein FAM32A
MPGEFVGGALSFKGDKAKIKKKKRRVKHELKQQTTESTMTTQTNEQLNVNTSSSIEEEGLTDAEKRALRRRLERERIDAEKIAQKSHRERIEEFNTKLASQTELNDIPRVSAAGNG